MKRWSSLQKKLYLIIDDRLDFQIHISKYRMKSRYGSTDMPRYWITLGNEIIFDYPRQFTDLDSDGNFIKNLTGKKRLYPYDTDISDISNLIREYIDTPKEYVFSKHFENDFWGLANILKASDKRTGKRRLEALRKKTHNKSDLKIIECRLKNYKP